MITLKARSCAVVLAGACAGGLMYGLLRPKSVVHARQDNDHAGTVLSSPPAAAQSSLLTTTDASKLSLLSYFWSESAPRSEEEVVVFTRYPRPGKCKTRLVPGLGDEGASKLHQKMAENAIMTARAFCLTRPKAGYSVHYSSRDTLEEVRAWLGNKVELMCQISHPNLGEKMRHAMDASFQAGSKRCVIMGSDCPDISPASLRNALDNLEENDIVLGPAKDGGFYLIAASSKVSENLSSLFAGVTWGTDTVLVDTLANAKRHGISVSLLQPLADVDEPGDVVHWDRKVARGAVPNECKISIVIPALNEEANIDTTVRRALEGGNVEVIVVDGGSSDGTARNAFAAGAKVVTSDYMLGRSRQQNYGAGFASGDIIMFCHADTILPPGFDDDVRTALCLPEVSATAFKLNIDGSENRLALRIIQNGANTRSERRQLPYGDQALCMRKGTFDDLGGFKDYPLMEDYDLVQRLQGVGKILTLNESVTTSSRRWDELGPIRTTIVNQVVVLAYKFGVSPRTLKQWYYNNVKYLKDVGKSS